MSKKIAVLITDEFEDSEFTSPAAEFRQAGHEVITIEKEAGKTVKGKKGEASVTIDKAIDDVRPTISTPCYYRAAIRRTICAATTASWILPAISLTAVNQSLPFATAHSC
ncbi:General stress protein 18 [Salmonella enterica subsp. arizonae]|uniref:General stress protein 18 n=1 Tax=Salmonella enterica subsp. arizonae TaxID=59203 RepID=A0A379T5R9_SALER|nr:General stress protein 18 [Salmonella enterica subsp. arizonae]